MLGQIVQVSKPQNSQNLNITKAWIRSTKLLSCSEEIFHSESLTVKSNYSLKVCNDLKIRKLGVEIFCTSPLEQIQ